MTILGLILHWNKRPLVQQNFLLYRIKRPCPTWQPYFYTFPFRVQCIPTVNLLYYLQNIVICARRKGNMSVLYVCRLLQKLEREESDQRSVMKRRYSLSDKLFLNSSPIATHVYPAVDLPSVDWLIARHVTWLLLAIGNILLAHGNRLFWRHLTDFGARNWRSGNLRMSWYTHVVQLCCWELKYLPLMCEYGFF